MCHFFAEDPTVDHDDKNQAPYQQETVALNSPAIYRVNVPASHQILTAKLGVQWSTANMRLCVVGSTSKEWFTLTLLQNLNLNKSRNQRKSPKKKPLGCNFNVVLWIYTFDSQAQQPVNRPNDFFANFIAYLAVNCLLRWHKLLLWLLPLCTFKRYVSVARDSLLPYARIIRDVLFHRTKFEDTFSDPFLGYYHQHVMWLNQNKVRPR